MRLGIVVGVLLATPFWARAQDSDPLPRRVPVASVSVAATAISYGELGGELEMHVYPHDVVRVSVLALGTVGPCRCGHLAGYAGIEYALRRAEDVSVWLGAFFGPMASLHGTIDAGASALLSLDIAIPISRAVAFDVLVRGGLDLADIVAQLDSQPFLYGGVGITWDFDAKSAEYKR